jgi:amino acid transporter
VQAIISGLILLLSQINETTVGAYQVLVSATNILYFIPFLYMYAAAIRLAYSGDRDNSSGAVLIPGGTAGVWIAGGLGFAVALAGILLSLVPPGDSSSKIQFELKLVGATGFAVMLGVVLFLRGARRKAREIAQSSEGAAI